MKGLVIGGILVFNTDHFPDFPYQHPNPVNHINIESISLASYLYRRLPSSCLCLTIYIECLYLVMSLSPLCAGLRLN